MSYKFFFLTILLMMFFSSSTIAGIKEGEPAPAFELADQYHKTHKLGDYRGKWVAHREFGISTVDNVDLARGQVSVVWALAGQAGSYGDQRTAKESFPKPQ